MDDAPPAPGETAAVYLGRSLIADRGFHPGVLPEAAALAEGCDLVLTGSDGTRLIVVCLIDRDADPDRRFTLSPEEVEQAARACHQQARGLMGGQAPVVIEVWEVGAGVPGADDRERLEALAFHQPGPGMKIETVAIDSLTGRTVSTLPGVVRLERAAWVERVLTGPRRDLRDARPARPLPIAHGRAWATLGLLAAMAVVFALELALAPVASTGFMSPHWTSLAALGGSEYNHVADGQVWRILTAAFLHGGPDHLLLNGVALFMVGSLLEHLLGRAWMLALFVLGAVGGSLLSLQHNGPGIVAVGASGAITGMMAAALLLALRMPRGPGRRSLLIVMAYMLIPALLPLATADSGQTIDYANHVGGAITGAVVGLILMVTWPRDATHPRATRLAWLVAGAGALVLVIGVVGVARGWSQEVADAERVTSPDGPVETARRYRHLMMPDRELPRDEAEWMARLPDLQARYPRDPRVRLLVAMDALERDDFTTARTQLEAALADIEIVRTFFANGELETFLRIHLAQVHLHLDDERRARQVIEPACSQAHVRDDPNLAALCRPPATAP